MIQPFAVRQVWKTLVVNETPSSDKHGLSQTPLRSTVDSISLSGLLVRQKCARLKLIINQNTGTDFPASPNGQIRH